MKNKSWLIAFFIFILLQVVAIEIFYRIYDYNRHYVDYLVKTKITNLKNKSFETVILGDSLAQDSIGKLKLHPHILNLTSNNALSLAGNYFLLKRYLKQNKRPKNLYLFCVPNHLHQDLNTIHTYSYFKSVFTQKDEIEEIQKIRPDFYNDYSFSKYTESRLKSIKFLTHFKPKKKVQAIFIDETTLTKRENFMNNKIDEKIKLIKRDQNNIHEIPIIYIEKITSLCKELGINFKLVIEPIPKASNRSFIQSKLYNYLKEKDVSIYNINELYSFNNYFFRGDGRHLHGKVNQYYQNLIDEYVLDIYQ